jgi:hypothetical protein
MRPLLHRAVLLSSCVLTGCVDFPADAITWGGTVLEDPYLGLESAAFVGGGIEAVDLDDIEISVGAESESTPGYYYLQEIPPSTEVALRVTGPDQTPVVWRSLSPSDAAIWLTGALFTRDATTLDETLQAFPLQSGSAPTALSLGDTCALWAMPLDPDAMAGATWTLRDGDGEAGELVALAVDDETGELVEAGSGPVDLIIGLELAPGDVTLDVEATDGRAASVTWPARGGDLLSGHFFALDAQ